MRMKGFIICTIIFTILYIVFFIVFDKVMTIRDKKKARERAISLIVPEQYTKFAAFYGVQATASLETIIKVLDAYDANKDYVISELANLYGISNFEVVVVFLYLEYIGVVNKRMFVPEMDSIKKITFIEQNMVQKYNTYFQEKRDLDTIIQNMGKNSLNDLNIMNKNFLMPGVRFIDSKLYYVGDYL